MEHVCPACGYVNRTLGIFCAKCGHRLTAPPRFRSRREWVWRLLGFVWGLVRVAVTAGLFTALGLLLWPPLLPPPVQDSALARDFEDTVNRLLQAVGQGRTASGLITERMINAYLAERVADLDVGKNWPKGKLRQVRVGFLPEGRVRTSVDRLYGPLRVVMAVGGKPRLAGRQLRFEVDEVKVGRLPIPVAISGWVSDMILSSLMGLEREWDVLARTQKLVVGEGRIELVVGP